MSDFENVDFFLDYWTSREKTRRRKKDSKKDKKGPKHKNSMTAKTNEKKKKAKFKEAMEARKRKKKDKKKKKKTLGLELDDGLLLKQAKLTETPAASGPRQNEKLKPDRSPQDSVKKTKRKKGEGFNLSSASIRVKRPKFVSSSQKQKEAVSCSQVTVRGHSQSETLDDNNKDSQCTSDDINSQDLFITQKKFRASEPSSGEASDEAVPASLQVLTQRDEASAVEIKHEEPNKRPRGSHFHQHGEKSDERVEEGDRRLRKLHQKEKMTSQKQMQIKVNLAEEKKGSSFHAANPYLDEPIVVKKNGQRSSSLLASFPPSTASTSTQTENLFTTELSSYLSFSRRSRETVCVEDLKPLDLSLPQRARMSEVRGDEEKHGVPETWLLPGESEGGRMRPHPAGSKQVKDEEVKKEVSSRGETTAGSQSESEPKSADTTNSSEDEPPGRSGKLNVTQVRAIQMRLNESFFFKTKGDGQSPRPESPLMKLAQGRDIKSRKSR